MPPFAQCGKWEASKPQIKACNRIANCIFATRVVLFDSPLEDCFSTHLGRSLRPYPIDLGAAWIAVLKSIHPSIHSSVPPSLPPSLHSHPSVHPSVHPSIPKSGGWQSRTFKPASDPSHTPSGNPELLSHLPRVCPQHITRGARCLQQAHNPCAIYKPKQQKCVSFPLHKRDTIETKDRITSAELVSASA